MKTIANHVENYLALRRALGFKLRVNGYNLRNFAKYCGERGATHITTKLAIEWATMPPNIKPETCGVRLGMVRILAKHVAAVDALTEIPARGILPARKHRAVCGFYGEDQVVALVEEARSVCKRDPFKGLTCSTLFGLLAVSGMRVAEALSLECSDVDLQHGVLSLAVTKGNKKRLVPLHPTATRELSRYLKVRAERFSPGANVAFFVTSEGRPLPYTTVNGWFLKIARRIGLRAAAPTTGIRLHDLRHHFAVQTLAMWYRQGVDVGVHLPELSTYLGHRYVTDTYWYLSAVPKLLKLAARRWQSAEGGPL